MKNSIKGNFLGRLCGDCSEFIENVKVRLYLPERNINVENALVSSEKDTFKVLTPEQIKEKENRLVGEGITDASGNFVIELKGEYNNTALEFDFECGTVPKFPHPHKKFPIRQFHVTTFYPKWDENNNNNDSIGYYNAILSEKIWCYIKGRFFDVWTICGILVDCKTRKPLAGIKVIAMDADFITDDELGSEVTDNNGHFVIYYDSAKFKKTFLSPIINIETDLTLPFASGPDVYFQLEYNGQKFALETSANRRNNVGYCLCVNLCSTNLIPVDSGVPPSFTHFGQAARIEIQNGINSITGKTGNYAFYSGVNMIGSINKQINGSQMEYMFEYQEVANPSVVLSLGVWQPVLPNMINKCEIGYLWTFTGDILNPIHREPYYINGVGTEKTITYNGNWIQVPQESNFAPNTNGIILNLDTTQLTGITNINMAMPTSEIGLATVSPARPHAVNRFFAICMRQRPAGGSATTAGTSKPIAIFNALYNNINKHGSWAPATASGQRAALSLDIDEIILGMSGCSKITSSLHIRYGARCENLGDINVTITGPHKAGQSFEFPAIANSPAPETFGTTQLVFTPPTDTVNDLLPCAYTVEASVSVLLTTGDGSENPVRDIISFCKV